MNIQAFTCRAKPDGVNDITEQSLQENCLYYGLPDIQGLLDPGHTLESIAQAIRAVHPEYKPRREAKMFWIFSRAANGAIVLAPKRFKQQTVYYIGEVIGDAYFLPEAIAFATAYRRAVHWYNEKAPLTKADLPEALITKINLVYNVTQTCLDISEFAQTLQALVRSNTEIANPEPVVLDRFREGFDRALAASLASHTQARQARLRTASRTPERRLVTSYEFVRNADVVAEVLVRAKGRCGRCGDHAPFRRVIDGTPYLEVHHIVHLARGGEDSVENAIALCPNCHRYMHHGFAESASQQAE